MLAASSCFSWEPQLPNQTGACCCGALHAPHSPALTPTPTCWDSWQAVAEATLSNSTKQVTLRPVRITLSCW
jgi:hypothetical protein